MLIVKNDSPSKFLTVCDVGLKKKKEKENCNNERCTGLHSILCCIFVSTNLQGIEISWIIIVLFALFPCLQDIDIFAIYLKSLMLLGAYVL